MGQYYYPVLMTAKGGKVIASFYSHAFDRNGLKLTEHSYCGNAFVESVIAKAMAQLKPVTLAWVGDYADYGEDLARRPDDGTGRDYESLFRRAYRATENDKTRVGPEDGEIVAYLSDAADVVIYDLALRQKLSVRRYRENVIGKRLETGSKPGWVDDVADFILHPLPLLTCIGNGKGGGDYQGTSMERIGSWALHPLAILPEGLPEPDGEWEDISESVLFEEGE